MIDIAFPTELKKIQNILVVGPAWIGDMMMAHTLIQLLKQRNPAAQIDVLASGWTRQLLMRMPEVNHVIEMPIGHGSFAFGERRALGKSLAQHRYDQAIVLPNSFKSAFIPFFADIPLRTGWRGEMRYGLLNDIRVLDKKRYPLMVQRYAALAFPKANEPLNEFPYPRLTVDQYQRPQLLTKFALQLNRPLLIICPGAEYGPAKRWPEHYFAEVADKKIRAGWQVWLMGSAKDCEVTDAIRQLLLDDEREYCFNLAGSTNLGEAIDLMDCADAVLSNDSGLMHIAAALQKPLAVIYGSTSPEHTPPLAQRVSIISNKIECAPCFERECPKVHHKCLRELMPQQVIAALDALTAQTAVLQMDSNG
ncbi:lipopolysaccharide heptosyltransferase II [Cellvibrio sp. UBA7661]|uniref:lipopolysaccharide heptosyltransferase II n=1 Tax=Cellvibrio sp. UBA7661 TaxID=1946311 RepID=UPI002F35F04A